MVAFYSPHYSTTRTAAVVLRRRNIHNIYSPPGTESITHSYYVLLLYNTQFAKQQAAAQQAVYMCMPSPRLSYTWCQFYVNISTVMYRKEEIHTRTAYYVQALPGISFRAHPLYQVFCVPGTIFITE